MAFLHTIPYGGGESTSIPPDSPHKSTSSTTATVPNPSIAKVRIIRRLHMYANRKSGMSKLFEPPWPSYTPYHIYGGGESTSIPPDSPHKSTSSTTATVPSPSIAKVRIIRRLHMYANRKSGMSKLFEPPWPSYTPYHMVAESRPLYLLIRLINPPLRLQRRYQAHPLLKYASFVVYICMPIVKVT